MKRASSRRAFTLVELIVTVGIFVLLMGILLPALHRVRVHVRKTTELNNLRTIGVAWTQYAVEYRDGLLPGYLDIRTQRNWNAKFKYPDGEVIPPAPDLESPPNYAGPWSWRLLPYLDNGVEMLLGYMGETLDERDARSRAEDIAFRPAFGANALFVGGWFNNGGLWLERPVRQVDSQEPLLHVSKSLGGVRRPSSLISFAASTIRQVGVYDYKSSVDDHKDGTFFVLPPTFGNWEIWGEPRTSTLTTPGGRERHALGYEQRSESDPFSFELYGGNEELLEASG